MATVLATSRSAGLLPRNGRSRFAAASRPRRVSRSTRAVKVQAKYGDESKYFDLDDLENTTGSWDLYLQDKGSRYPKSQADFFYRAAEPASRRETVRALVALFGIGGIVFWGAKGSKDISLPIQKGPQTKGENGKGGSIRSKL